MMEQSNVGLIGAPDPWSNELILEFINLYEKQEILWNPSAPNRTNKSLNKDAWKQIQANLSVQLDISDLKRKKDSLLASYRTIRRKMIEMFGKDGLENELYKPTWFAYSAIDKFFRPREKKCKSVLPYEQESQEAGLKSRVSKRSRRRPYSKYVNLTKAMPQNCDKSELGLNGTSDLVPNNEYSDSLPSGTSDLGRNRTSDFRPSCNSEYMESSLSEPLVFGQSVGLQLRDVETKQRVIAEKVISEVLFHAKLGNLEESSTILLSRWQLAEEEEDASS